MNKNSVLHDRDRRDRGSRSFIRALLGCCGGKELVQSDDEPYTAVQGGLTRSRANNSSRAEEPVAGGARKAAAHAPQPTSHASTCTTASRSGSAASQGPHAPASNKAKLFDAGPGSGSRTLRSSQPPSRHKAGSDGGGTSEVLFFEAQSQFSDETAGITCSSTSAGEPASPAPIGIAEPAAAQSALLCRTASRHAGSRAARGYGVLPQSGRPAAPAAAPPLPGSPPSSPLAAWPGPAALLARTQNSLHQQQRQQGARSVAPSAAAVHRDAPSTAPASCLQHLPSDLTAAFVLLCADDANQLAAGLDDPDAAAGSRVSSSGEHSPGRSSPGPGSTSGSGCELRGTSPWACTTAPRSSQEKHSSPGGLPAATAQPAGAPAQQGSSASPAAPAPAAPGPAEAWEASSKISAILRRLTTVGPGRELAALVPAWIPQPPLQFDEQGPATSFVPVPVQTAFSGYWRKHERTTPPPLPIDLLLEGSWLLHKAKAGAQGIEVSETSSSWTMRFRVSLVGFTHNYSETFDKAGGESSWFMRRDMRVGSSAGQLFFTADGRAVLRTNASGVRPAAYFEDYISLEGDGRVCVVRQYARHLGSGQVASQQLVGFK